MKRTAFAFAVAVLTLASVSISQAAPIAPLPSGIATDAGQLMQVRWWGHWHGHWGHWGYWHCRHWWNGRWHPYCG
jgi:hypothetical protein